MQAVIELPTPYLAKASKLMSAEEQKGVVDLIAANPECGDVISGTGGVRKVRFAREGQGKSGSYRIVYYYYNETLPIFLITCFGKNQKDNLSASEKNTVKKLVQVLHEYGD